MRRIEKRGAVNVLCDDDGCSPATKAEAEFFDEIERLRAEVEALRADAERLDCGQIMIDTRDEFGEPKQVWHTGMNLRAAIDAAIKAGLK